ALEQDSIHSLVDKAPLMVLVLISTTMVLMFLAFGSVVLPIKAAVMSVLTLGSTMGILTWIFIDGHGSGLLNFTPTPLMVVIIALVVAVGYGLATDYEVFLVSRMVEARENGMSTQEAIRIGTATTGRLITAAALVLAVVAGSFVFSDLVMMKYLAFGLMAALLLDATVVRMFLVPSVMKLLGDDCWWAPRWMRRLQNRIGLGEIQLPDERKRPASKVRPPVTAGLVAATPRPPHDPTHPAALERARPAARPELGPAQNGPIGASQVPVRAAAPANQSPEPPTARLKAPGSQGPQARSNTNGPSAATTRPPRPIPTPKNAPPAPAPPPAPSADQTNKMPVAGSRPEPKPANTGDPADKTAALPVQRAEGDDAETATEKLNTRDIQGENTENTVDTGRRRRGGSGGLSAQDLLRREGRL
ncbi:MAG: trehalose monomycolate/heme transporter, partial [Mycobacterium sp.]|nr:trehalose monomycolate/heme transporter [Mycobacterium sp.]